MLAIERLAESALHRMSQPLTAIRCLLEFALEQDEPEVLRDFSQRSLQESERLVAMMHAFREMLMLGSRSRKTEVMRLEDVLETISGAMALSEKRTIECSDATDGIGVLVNRAALDTVIWNLNGVVGTYDCGRGCICRVGQETIHLRWELTGGDAAAWEEELAVINPFAVAGYDFAENGIPRLTTIKTIAEAMGGDLLCDGRSLELRLARAVGVKANDYGAAESNGDAALQPMGSKN